MNTGQPPRKQRRFEDTSHKTPGPRPGLHPSPRGGMLYAGGVPGNRGGTAAGLAVPPLPPRSCPCWNWSSPNADRCW
jgi:hypothetical protein